MAGDGKLRVLLVDDEPLARESLRHLLAADPEVSVVGECGDGVAALASIDEFSPDIVLLDIQMPEIDGFEVLRRLPSRDKPEIVFVSAFDRYAVRAFEVHAVDYLLKPVGTERFREALERAKRRVRRRLVEGAGRAGWARLVEEGVPAPDFVTRFSVRLHGRIRFVQAADIDWIEAADYYSRLHVAGRGYLLRRSMKSLERDLDPRSFARVHRGAIVQIDRVVELRRLAHGAYEVLLRDGTSMRLSRSRRSALESLLAEGSGAGPAATPNQPGQA